jgi:hypothetical protein
LASPNEIFRVGIVELGYELDHREIEVRFAAEIRDISLPHSVQTSSEAHPASYPMGTGDPSLGCKAAEA